MSDAPVLDGVLVLDKPPGPTSFDIVRRVRRATRVRRVGHGGTLDPLASGVLPICLGEATKLAPFLLDADKAYDFTIRLGVETDSYDAAGAVTATADAAAVTEAQLRAALPAFTGAIEQRPPVYSALKRDGRPLYDYARAGEAVEIAPRAVTIFELELVAWGGPEAVALRMRCSKGTYVRSLAFDLGRALGVGAHVTALRRTRSGPFALAEAQPLDAFLTAAAEGAPLPLVRPEDALGHLPRGAVDSAGERTLEQGKRLPWTALEGAPDAEASNAARVCVLRPDGRLLAVATPRPDGTVRTLRVFGVASGPQTARIH
ncbi:MAG TPA: tRNA pseudouridine(55) synthase TruB [Polyangia bacterium]|nr:tRNA pseudouridine(55) synthase TruB [Polyangia bacterium]